MPAPFIGERIAGDIYRHPLPFNAVPVAIKRQGGAHGHHPARHQRQRSRSTTPATTRSTDNGHVR